MQAIVRRSAGILGIPIDDDAVARLATGARGTPRVVNRLLRRMRDFAQVKGNGRITLELVDDSFKRLEIDSLGLERYDREILRAIAEKYGGGPVGAETLAISVGESVDTLEDYYEPFLIQSGLVQRTPRGRILTQAAYEHLGLRRNIHGNDGILF